MKMTKKKRSGKKKSNSADEAARMTGTGAARNAAKAIQKNRETKRQRLGDIMSGLSSSRRRK